MALLWCDGFDHYGTDTARMTEGPYDQADAAFTLSEVNPRTGARCLRRDSSAATQLLIKDLSGPHRTLGTGFSLQIDQLPDIQDSYVAFSFRDQNGDVQLNFFIQPDGSIEVKLVSGVVIASSDTGIIFPGQYAHFETGVYFDIGEEFENIFVNSYDVDFDSTDPNDITTDGDVPPPNALTINTNPTSKIVISLPEERAFEAWNAWSNVDLPDEGWLNRFFYKADGGTTAASDSTRYATPTEARESFNAFALTGFSEYIIFMSDPIIGDNEGGLSIHVDEFAEASLVAQGLIECRLNGVTIISEVGVTTCSTINKESSFIYLQFGSEKGHGVVSDIDDWYVWNDAGAWNNSFLGDRRCLLMKPNQDTNIADFDPSSGSFGYKMIDDDSPDDDATYIIAEAYLQSGSPLTGTSEFEIEDLPDGTSLISAVNVVTRASKTDSTSAEIFTSINSGADSLSANANILTTSYQYFNDIYEYDPESISSITRDNFNAMSVSVTADDLDPGSLAESPTDLDFDPSDLDSYGADWVWLDPSDLLTLWQDTSATTPVTADGQTVNRIDDKSGYGNHAVSAGSNGPTYRTDGTYHWLEFNGSTQYLTIGSNANFDSDMWTSVMGYKVNTTAATGVLVGFNWSAGGTNSNNGHQLFQSGGGNIACLARTSGGSAVLAQQAGTTNKAIFTGKWQNDVNNTVSLWIDNGSANTNTGATMTPSSHVRTAIGVTASTLTSGFLNGNIYGIILLPEDLSVQDREDTRDWMNGKTGAF